MAAISQRSTPAGRSLARTELVRRGDLGSGWSQVTGPPRKAPSLTCSSFNPSPPAVEVGRAESPTFGQSSSGPFVSEIAYVYATPAQEANVWKSVVRPQFARCVAQLLVEGSGGGVNFRVIRKQALSLPGLPVPARWYRVYATATNAGQTTDLYFDTVVLERGRTVTTLSISSFDAPVALKLELRLARAAGRRLTSA